MISLAFCSPFNNNNYPPSPLYSPPPAPPIPHNSPANNGEPDFPSPFDFPPPPPPITSQDINGGNKDYEWDDNLVLAGIAVLCFAFLIAVSIYYLYVYWRSNRQRLRQEERRRLRRLRISRNRGFSRRVAEDWFLASPREGLRRAMVDALPVFVYKPENFTDVLRCAVCLCEFQENEKAKLLPSCNHSFHVDCIDMWFYSHSTCPLCRARVDPQAVEMEISVREEEEEEEADDKVLMSSSEAEEQHIQGVDKNNGDSCEEEGSGEHDAIDIPTTEAAEQHIQSVNKNDGDSCEEEGSGEHAAIDMPTTEN